MKEVVKVLNRLFDEGKTIITVKKLRRTNDIVSEDKTKINFYWRTLKTLEERGYLKKIEYPYKSNNHQYEMTKVINLNSVLAELFDIPENPPITILNWDKGFRMFNSDDVSYKDGNLAFIKAKRETDFLEGKKTSELFIVEEYIKDKKRFIPSLAFRSKDIKEKYLKIMNKGLNGTNFKTSTLNIKLIE